MIIKSHRNFCCVKRDLRSLTPPPPPPLPRAPESVHFFSSTDPCTTMYTYTRVTGRDTVPYDPAGRLWCAACPLPVLERVAELPGENGERTECTGIDGWCASAGTKGSGRAWCKHSGTVNGAQIVGTKESSTSTATPCYFCEQVGQGQPLGKAGCKKCMHRMTAPMSCESCPERSCMTNERRCVPTKNEKQTCEEVKLEVAARNGAGGLEGGQWKSPTTQGAGVASGGAGVAAGGSEASTAAPLDDPDDDLDGPGSSLPKQMRCKYCPGAGGNKCRGAELYCNSGGKVGGAHAGKHWCQSSGKGLGPFAAKEVRGLTDQEEAGATVCFPCTEGSQIKDCSTCQDEMVSPGQCTACNKGACKDKHGRCGVCPKTNSNDAVADLDGGPALVPVPPVLNPEGSGSRTEDGALKARAAGKVEKILLPKARPGVDVPGPAGGEAAISSKGGAPGVKE